MYLLKNYLRDEQGDDTVIPCHSDDTKINNLLVQASQLYETSTVPYLNFALRNGEEHQCRSTIHFPSQIYICYQRERYSMIHHVL